MNKSFGLILLVLFISSSSCQNSHKEDREKFELALSLFNEQNYQEAIVYLDSLLERDPSNYTVWCLKGRSLFNHGREADGIKAMDKAIALRNDYYDAYRYRAIMKCLLPDADYDEVINDFRVAIENDTQDADFIKSIVGFMATRGHFEEALETLKHILVIDSTDYQANVLHAHLIWKLGSSEEALDMLNDIILYQDASQFTAFEERAYVHENLEQYDSAVADYSRVLSGIEKDSTFGLLTAYTYNNRGYAKFKAGRPEDALVDINHSIRLAPENCYAFKNRGEVLIHQNKVADGCSDFKKAVDLGFLILYGDELNVLIEKNCR